MRSIWTEVSHKVRSEQTQRVVINLTDWRGDIAMLKRQFDSWPVSGLKELAILDRTGRISQFTQRHRQEQ
ncbi:hypothetical protein GCM10012279_53090 [Micromonospora yangpuensis]|nr:hypothetical protein GCM10012279_53090 [Micromonospora yangpuensis]